MTHIGGSGGGVCSGTWAFGVEFFQALPPALRESGDGALEGHSDSGRCGDTHLCECGSGRKCDTGHSVKCSVFRCGGFSWSVLCWRCAEAWSGSASSKKEKSIRVCSLWSSRGRRRVSARMVQVVLLPRETVSGAPTLRPPAARDHLLHS